MNARPAPTAHRSRATRWALITALALTTTLLLASCTDSSPSATPVAAQAPATAAPGSAETVVKTAESTLGTILTDEDGGTLYGFTKDDAGTPTCTDGCATAWPPLTVPTAELPAGLDPKVFSVVSRPDGTHQLKAGTWPLYRFAGDDAPGAVNGQGSGGNWFAAAPDGSLLTGTGGGSTKATPAPAPTTTEAPTGRDGY